MVKQVYLYTYPRSFRGETGIAGRRIIVREWNLKSCEQTERIPSEIKVKDLKYRVHYANAFSKRTLNAINWSPRVICSNIFSSNFIIFKYSWLNYLDSLSSSYMREIDLLIKCK